MFKLFTVLHLRTVLTGGSSTVTYYQFHVLYLVPFLLIAKEVRIFAIYLQCPSTKSRTAFVVFYVLYVLYVLSLLLLLSVIH